MPGATSSVTSLTRKGDAIGYLLSDGKFQRIQDPGFPVTLVTSINNAGDIVGLYGDDNNAYISFAPEMASSM